MDPLPLLPQPILPAHPEWVELYLRAWELAVRNIGHGTPQNGFAESYLDDAFSDNIFQWDTCFIVQYARCTTWHPSFRIAGGVRDIGRGTTLD